MNIQTLIDELTKIKDRYGDNITVAGCLNDNGELDHGELTAVDYHDAGSIGKFINLS